VSPLQYCSLCKIYTFEFCLPFIAVMCHFKYNKFFLFTDTHVHFLLTLSLHSTWGNKVMFIFGAGCNILIQSGDDAIKC